MGKCAACCAYKHDHRCSTPYLPWVEQACGLKQSHASKLIRAAKWVNQEHAPDINKIADTATLFLLSADATPEDVREWALERCAAAYPLRLQVRMPPA